MPLIGNVESAANAPKNKTIVAASGIPAFKINSNVVYQNTTPSAIVPGEVVGLYGVTKTMVQAAKNVHGVYLSQPGWTLLRQGTGSVASISATPGGAGYANTDYVRLTANGLSTLTFNCTTNATGGIISLTPGANGLGAGFPNTSYITTLIANSTGTASVGTGATIVITLGGRAGRVSREVLWSVNSMTSTSNTPFFPNA